MGSFYKMIKLGLALVILGSFSIAIHDQMSILSDIVYDLICIGLLGFGSILFIIGVYKSDTI